MKHKRWYGGLVVVALGFWNIGGMSLIASSPLRVLEISLEAQVHCRWGVPTLLPGSATLQATTLAPGKSPAPVHFRAEGFSPDRREMEFELRGRELRLRRAQFPDADPFVFGEVDLSQVRCSEGSPIEDRPHRLTLPVSLAPGLRMSLERSWRWECESHYSDGIDPQLHWLRKSNDRLSLWLSGRTLQLQQTTVQSFENWLDCRLDDTEAY